MSISSSSWWHDSIFANYNPRRVACEPRLSYRVALHRQAHLFEHGKTLSQKGFFVELYKHVTHLLRFDTRRWSKRPRSCIKLKTMPQLSRYRTLRKSRAEIKRANQQLSRPNLEFKQYSELVITECVIDHLNDRAIVMVSPIQSRCLRFCGGGNQIPPLPRSIRFGGKCSKGRMPGVAENAH